MDRAIRRRIEFRRIKKQFEFEASVHPDPKEDRKMVSEKTDKFVTAGYNFNSAQKPKFLSNTDYYFMKTQDIDEAGKTLI